MNSTIKGVRYSYQISYMNQAPTHLKSQIHNLPVVSEPQQTPLDISQNQDQYIPSNDARMSYAAPTAAVSATPSVNEVSGGATTIPSARSTMATGGIGYAGPQRINAPTDVNPLLTETNISEPQQVARAAQAESVVSHPALSVAAQAGLDGNLGNVLHPTQNFIGIDKIASDIPTSDATPIEGVKANPRADFHRAERAYIPNQNSFFQKNGLESVVTDGSQLEANAVANAGATAPVEFSNLIQPANATESLEPTASASRSVPSYMIPSPDETDDNSTGGFFNRYLGQQAKNLYNIIGGAINPQLQTSNLNLLF